MEETELLKIENLTYKSDKNDLLIDISFSVKKGENVVIFGPEDSGIEIICPMIAGLISGYQGDIFFKGKSIKSLNYIETHDYRKEMGYLQRDYGLISNMSVFENISLPLKYHSKLSSIEIEELVNNKIKAMNLEHCKNQRPVNLKRSEKLKTAFLRSIVLSPDLLLLEHSVESQCVFNIQSFFNALNVESLTGTKSFIFVTYDPKLFVNLANKFIMLYKGNIVFSGSRAEFASADTQYLQQYLYALSDGPMILL
ncbi:MAG: ATP-binding cassette domain-containing protein [Spirochaetota bacterium]